LRPPISPRSHVLLVVVHGGGATQRVLAGARDAGLEGLKSLSWQ